MKTTSGVSSGIRGVVVSTAACPTPTRHENLAGLRVLLQQSALFLTSKAHHLHASSEACHWRAFFEAPPISCLTRGLHWRASPHEPGCPTCSIGVLNGVGTAQTDKGRRRPSLIGSPSSATLAPESPVPAFPQHSGRSSSTQSTTSPTLVCRPPNTSSSVAGSGGP